MKKLGVSVGLLSALAFFLSNYSMTACVILLAVILACGADAVLKKNALEATVLAVIISLVQTVLSFLSRTYSSIITFFTDLLGESWYEVYDVADVLRKLDFADSVYGFINFAYFIVTVVFIIIALKGGVVKIPVITKMVEKHMTADKEE